LQPALGIRKLGFKRWFERQLIESHLFLVTCFLCLVLVLAVLEELASHASVLERTVMFAVMLGGTALGIFSWNRYRAILFRALQLSERSTCEGCGAHARFSVVDSGRAYVGDIVENHDEAWLKVRCAKCGHQWTMA